MSTALVPVSDLEKMAAAVATSKLFGITSKEQALALMLVAQAEGLHPATAARDYHIIQGRPALKADAMLGRYINSGGKVEWHDHTDAKVSATFSHPSGGALKIDWDLARAKAAGLADKDMWKKYPRQMLRARVISEGVRATNPNVSIGIYTPEEARDMTEKDMGAAEVVIEDIDWGKNLTECANLGTLKAMWDGIPDADKPKYKDAKDKRKAELAKAAEPA